MLRNPHAMLEGILIMTYAVRAAAGLRLHPRRVPGRVRGAARRPGPGARARPRRGRELFGSGYAADIVLHRGAGAYICGEETALLSSLNGYRGQPTAKPPFPAVAGAFQKPTLLNNVETHATVPYILRWAPSAYAKIGTEQSKGTRVLSLSGHVTGPGNYELPFDLTLRRPDRGLRRRRDRGPGAQGDHPGRLLGAVLGPEGLGSRLAIEALAAAGTMAGSGAVMVIDEGTCMVQLALRTAEFYRHESCGKCTPCREGTAVDREHAAPHRGGRGPPRGDRPAAADLRQHRGQVPVPARRRRAMPVRASAALPGGVRAARRRGRLPAPETSQHVHPLPAPEDVLPLVARDVRAATAAAAPPSQPSHRRERDPRTDTVGLTVDGAS